MGDINSFITLSNINKGFKQGSESDLITIIKNAGGGSQTVDTNINIDFYSPVAGQTWHWIYTIFRFVGETALSDTARIALYIFDESISTTNYYPRILKNFNGNTATYGTSYTPSEGAGGWSTPFTSLSARDCDYAIGSCDCIPIFARKSEAQNYINTGQGLENALNNYEPETEAEGSEFTIYNTGQRGTWKPGDIVEDVSTPFYRWARLKLATSDQVDGRFAFYRAGLDNDIIKLIPTYTASVISCEYSTDGGANWQESNEFPFEYIFGERINELGTFIYATRSGLSGETGVPVFETQEEAAGWVNHDPDVSIDQALNYSQIAGTRYPITNPTGIDENNTTMGTNAGIASLFSQKYLCNKSDIEKIARALFDTGAGHIWEDIKTGLEMMGENPINAVCGLQYFPIDLSQVFSRVSSQTYVYFGGYYFKPSEHGEQSDLNILKILGYDGYIDLGEFTIERSFTPAEDIRNFEPYCNLQIYLPYIGLQKLSYNKYVGKTIKARYYIDINSGGCLACLFCNNILMDFFNGNMGVNLPITLTDFAGYAEAQLNNLASFAGVGGNAAGAISAGASGNITGAAGASVASIAGFEKSLYEVSTTNLDQFNTTKGGSSALGNGYLPQYIYLVFEFIQTDETPNLIQLAGRASNASGVLNSFSGYLEVDDIELKTTAGMTENEKAEFISLLHSGIII